MDPVPETFPEDPTMQAQAALQPLTAGPDARVHDDVLVTAARRGEQAAFEALYRRHAATTYGLCLRLVADATLAEQLTQDAFVRAWQRLGSFRQEARFATWLHRLTVNVVLDWRRQRDRRGRREVAADDAGGLDTAATAHPAPPPAVAERLDLERAIARLPEGARTIFVLHDVQGFPLKEIAALQGIAEGTVKAQLFRARRLLREALK